MKFLQPQVGTREAGSTHSWQGAEGPAVCRGTHFLECEAKEAAYKVLHCMQATSHC